jgi:hypothetical protein
VITSRDMHDCRGRCSCLTPAAMLHRTVIATETHGPNRCRAEDLIFDGEWGEGGWEFTKPMCNPTLLPASYEGFRFQIRYPGFPRSFQANNKITFEPRVK